MLALTCHVKRSGRLAVIVAQESAKPFVALDENPRSPKLLQFQ